MGNKRSPLDMLAIILATVAPSGLMPFAPGTWGSAVAVVAAPWIFLPWTMPVRAAILVAVMIIGTWAADRAEKAMNLKDPGCIVIDEVLGQWIAMLPLAAICEFTLATLWPLALAFVLFRFFDILKPWPIRNCERIFPGGLGVMVDDVVAGVYAAAIMIILPLTMGLHLS